MRVVRYLLYRLTFILPQLLGIVLVSFFLVKSIPGDPAVLMLGPTATPDAIASLRTQMGLDQPLYMQFILYVNHLLHGDLGTSWQTTRPVLEDLIQRFPATLELVTFSLILAIAVGMGLGVASAMNPKGWIGRLTDLYGLSAGALPDFWFALVLIFVFYTLARWSPAPLGRLDIEVLAPNPDHRVHDDRHAAGGRHAGVPLRRLPLDPAGVDARIDQRRADHEDDPVQHGEDAFVRRRAL